LEKRTLGRSKKRLEDNIKMNLREVGFENRRWMELSDGMSNGRLQY
jgi:hypothetical protein